MRARHIEHASPALTDFFGTPAAWAQAAPSCCLRRYGASKRDAMRIAVPRACTCRRNGRVLRGRIEGTRARTHVRAARRRTTKDLARAALAEQAVPVRRVCQLPLPQPKLLDRITLVRQHDVDEAKVGLVLIDGPAQLGVAAGRGQAALDALHAAAGGPRSGIDFITGAHAAQQAAARGAGGQGAALSALGAPSSPVNQQVAKQGRRARMRRMHAHGARMRVTRRRGDGLSDRPREPRPQNNRKRGCAHWRASGARRCGRTPA